MKNLLGQLPLIGVCLAVLISFQNCGQTGFSTSEEGLSSSLSESVSSGLKIPFPYKYEPNQIAYNSCYANELSSPALWTFAVGAFKNQGTPAASLSSAPAGMTMRPQFLEALEAHRKEMIYQDPQKSYYDLLSSLPQLRESKLHFSIREQSKVRSVMYVGSSGDIDENMSFVGPDLNSLALFDRFYKNPTQYFDYIWDAGQAERSLSGSFRFPLGNNPADLNVHRQISSSAYLVAGFAYNNGREAQAQIGPELIGPEPFDPKKEKVFGVGYRLNFRGHTGINGYDYPLDRGMIIDREVDLESTTQITSNYRWNCSLRLKIVSQADRNKSHYSFSTGYLNGTIQSQAPGLWATCPQEDHCQLSGACNDPSMSFQDIPSNAQVIRNKALLHAIRRFLPAENWDVNVSRKCVVPKFSGCYKSNQKIIYDDYFFQNDNDELKQYAGCGPDHPGDCPHFITLCIKR